MTDTRAARSTKRRRFLQLAGAATAVGLAGCADDEGDAGEGDEADDPEEEEPADDPEEGDADEDPDGGEDPEDTEQYTLTVTVEDDTGEPVEGATVTIEGDEGLLDGVFGDGGDENEAETGADGQVEAQLEEGEYTVTAEHEEFDGTGEEDVTLEDDDEVTVTLGEGGDDDGAALDEDGEDTLSLGGLLG